MKNDSLYANLMLEYTMDVLAEDLVLRDEVSMCGMCVHGGCDHQVSGLTCRQGIKTALLRQSAQYVPQFHALLSEQFSYLTALRNSGKTNMFGALRYQQKQYPQWSDAWHNAVLRLWMEEVVQA